MNVSTASPEWLIDARAEVDDDATSDARTRLRLIACAER
jgi:hypothetical protein